MADILNFYICDDDNFFSDSINERIIEIVAKIPQNKYRCEMTVFKSGLELLGKYDSKKVNAVFLDIDMPDINGFDLASRLQKINREILIVFVTNHEDKVFQSYEYHPFWFVRKSHIDDLDFIVKELVHKINTIKESNDLRYNLKAENKTIELDINAIVSIEAYKNDLIIKDRFSNKTKIRCKLSTAEKQLAPFNIVRVQKGVLINCRFISKITSREVILTTGVSFGLGRTRIDDVRREYLKFVRSKLV